MNEQPITLDLRKTGFGKRVVIRQNDYHGITLAVDVTDGSKAYSVPAAAKCCLMARLLGSYVRDGGCTVEGGRIVYTADERMFGASGTAEAYFRIEVDGAAYSTEGFQLVVERAADSHAQLSEAYDTEVDQAIRDAETAAAKADDAAEGAKAAGGRADAAAKKADGAAAKAEAWAGKVDAATEAATDAAEKAEAAAQQATAAANKVFPAADNVLTGSASGAVAHAEDAFEGGTLRGIAVEGACRQDGVPSPDAPKPIAVVENPELAIVGRNHARIAADMPRADCDTDFAATAKRIIPPGTYIEGLTFNNYLAPNNISGLKIAEGSISFDTTDSTYGVGVSVNLANGATYIDSVADYHSFYDEDGTFLRYVYGRQFQVPDDAAYIVAVFRAGADGHFSASNISITHVADNGAYAPYTSQTLTFALPAEHPYLAKLPDGTADAIEVDEAGNVELVARVGKVVPTKDNTLFYSDPNGAPYVNVRFETARRDASLMCSSHTVSKWTTESGFIYCPSTSGLIVRDSRFASIDGALKLLEDTVIYVAIQEKRYPLAPIDMPKAQDSIVNAWTDAEVTPSTSIRYIRDVNIVVANIESAIASIS